MGTLTVVFIFIIPIVTPITVTTVIVIPIAAAHTC